MSTNFYLGTESNHEEYHLGKRSGGWAFLFRARSELGVVNLRTWYESAKKRELKGYKLFNDNNSNENNLKELLKTILELKNKKSSHIDNGDNDSWQDDSGNSFHDREFS